MNEELIQEERETGPSGTEQEGGIIAAAAETGRKEKAQRIAAIVSEMYPNPPPGLFHETVFQLLVAVIMSARCTDKKVNELTPELFRAYPDAHAMATAPFEDVLEKIRGVTFCSAKARHVCAMSKLLTQQFGGNVPDDAADLTALPGVGNKTANVVLSQGFGKSALGVDTHIHRLARRWGLSDPERSVDGVEEDLKHLLPDESKWRDLHLQLIYFGRDHCPAARHDPTRCPVCSWAGCRV